MIVDYFKKEEICHNIPLIAERLTLAEVSHFEIALGKSGVVFFENYYRYLVQKYFSKLSFSDKKTFKQRFKKVILDLLAKIEKNYSVSVSVYEFYEAAAGRVSALVSKGGSCAAYGKRGLSLAIYYSYYGLPLQEKNPEVLEMLAFLLSFRKEYAALETLWEVAGDAVLREQYDTLESMRSVVGFDDVIWFLEDREINDQSLSICIENIRDIYCVGPIHFYIFYGHVEKAKELLLCLSTAQEMRCLGYVLQLFAYNGHIALVQAVLNLGREKEISVKSKGKALLNAVYCEHIEVACELVTRLGKDISKEDKGKALLHALDKKHLEMVKTLVTCVGKDISKEDKGKALQEIVYYKDPALVQYLLNCAGEEISKEDKSEALFNGIRERDLEIEVVWELVTCVGKDMSKRHKGIALRWIVQYADPALALYLFNCGGEEISKKDKGLMLLSAIDAITQRGFFPPKIPREKRLKMVWELVTRVGKDISGEHKGIALNKIVYYRDIGLALYLLKCEGEEISRKDKGLAFKEAITYFGENLKVIRELWVFYGKELSQKDKDQALLEAMGKRPIEIIWELLTYFGKDILKKNKGKIFQEIVFYRDPALVQYLLDCIGEEICLKDKIGAFQKAVAYHDPTLVEYFLHLFGKEISTKVKQECLDAAVSKAAFGVVLKLLEGAKEAISRERKHTLLEWLLQYKLLGTEERKLVVEITLNILESLHDRQSFLEVVWNMIGNTDETLSLQYKDRVLQWAIENNLLEVANKVLYSDGEKLAQLYRATQGRRVFNKNTFLGSIQEEISYGYKGMLITKAVKDAKVDMLSLLLEYSKREIRFVYTLHALREAINYKKLVVVTFLLKECAYQISVAHKSLALQWTACTGQAEIVECLLEYAGKEISVEDKGAALQAAAYGHSNSVISNQFLMIVRALLCKRKGQEEISIEDIIVARQKAVKGKGSAIALYLSEYLHKKRGFICHDLEIQIAKRRALRALSLKATHTGEASEVNEPINVGEADLPYFKMKK